MELLTGPKVGFGYLKEQMVNDNFQEWQILDMVVETELRQ